MYGGLQKNNVTRQQKGPQPTQPCETLVLTNHLPLLWYGTEPLRIPSTFALLSASQWWSTVDLSSGLPLNPHALKWWEPLPRTFAQGNRPKSADRGMAHQPPLLVCVLDNPRPWIQTENWARKSPRESPVPPGLEEHMSTILFGLASWCPAMALSSMSSHRPHWSTTRVNDIMLLLTPTFFSRRCRISEEPWGCDPKVNWGAPARIYCWMYLWTKRRLGDKWGHLDTWSSSRNTLFVFSHWWRWWRVLDQEMRSQRLRL